jgi:hypothetical protein
MLDTPAPPIASYIFFGRWRELAKATAHRWGRVGTWARDSTQVAGRDDEDGIGRGDYRVDGYRGRVYQNA